MTGIMVYSRVRNVQQMYFTLDAPIMERISSFLRAKIRSAGCDALARSATSAPPERLVRARCHFMQQLRPK